LGGLTARAIQLKDQFSHIPFYEVYPSYLSKKIGVAYDKMDIKTFHKIVSSYLPNIKIPKIENKHQFDSLLCLLSGVRHSSKQHLIFGDLNEGAIII
jgi:hypothetical protein